MQRHGLVVLLALVLVGLLTPMSWAVVMIANSGMWPEDWPKELAPLRPAAKTLDVVTGIQETIYEIPIPDRETFEKIWPALVKIRTPESSVTLYAAKSAPPKAWGTLLSNEHPTVRIYAPSRSKGNAQAIAAVVGKQGELPEYVVQEKDAAGQTLWSPADPRADRPPRGFYYRARTDLELVVDGKVVDLGRVKLPEDARVVDHRSDEKRTPPPER